MEHIPVHRLNDRANHGLEMKYIGKDAIRHHGEILGTHRDDHYVFFLVEKGSGSMMIDFSEIVIPEKCICYVLPGQVHRSINTEASLGWFMAVDTSLIPPEFRRAFEDRLLLQQPYLLSESSYRQCRSLIHLLYEQYSSDPHHPFYRQLTHALLTSFLGMAAYGYSQDITSLLSVSRPLQIAREFKRLLSGNITTEKRPSAYAGMLNISESYLNESLKKVTGFSVTYWILHEVMLEAKRLLYYTPLNVKEIAHRLGYDDHTYFSRLFKKANLITPLAFRGNYRK